MCGFLCDCRVLLCCAAAAADRLAGWLAGLQEHGESGGVGRGEEKSIEDDEDGHLIYRAGDLLQARCNHIPYPPRRSHDHVSDVLLFFHHLCSLH